MSYLCGPLVPTSCVMSTDSQFFLLPHGSLVSLWFPFLLGNLPVTICLLAAAGIATSMKSFVCTSLSRVLFKNELWVKF